MAKSTTRASRARRSPRDRIVTDLQTLAADAEVLLKATASDISDQAQEARSRFVAAVDQAKETCSEWQEESVEWARTAAGKADDAIRKRPYESLGIAFGLGILIGVLFRRR